MPYSKKTIDKYIKSFDKLEKMAMEIAKEDLGTSFNIEKSVGFINWLKKNKV
jgi:hypothetical protein